MFTVCSPPITRPTVFPTRQPKLTMRRPKSWQRNKQRERYAPKSGLFFNSHFWDRLFRQRKLKQQPKWFKQRRKVKGLSTLCSTPSKLVISNCAGKQHLRLPLLVFPMPAPLNQSGIQWSRRRKQPHQNWLTCPQERKSNKGQHYLFIQLIWSRATSCIAESTWNSHSITSID